MRARVADEPTPAAWRGGQLHTDVGRMARLAGRGPTDRRQFETTGLALAVREASTASGPSC